MPRRIPFLSWSLVAVILAASAGHALGVESQQELNGFVLGQHFSVLESLGEPEDEGTTGKANLRYLVFPLGDPAVASLVALLEPNKTGYIYALQITGRDHPSLLPFAGKLRLGATEKEIVAVFGQPKEKTPLNSSEGKSKTLWSYYPNNFTMELDDKGKLYSIKLYGYFGFETNLMPVPPLADLIGALRTQSVDAMMKVLMPDVEVRMPNGDHIGVSQAMRKELADPKSKLREVLLTGNASLLGVLTSGGGKVELGHRMMTPPSPYKAAVLAKFPEPSVLEELVFVEHAGHLKLWEAKFRLKGRTQ